MALYNKFERIDAGTWLFTGEWLGYNQAHHYMSDLSEEYPAAVCWFNIDYDDRENDGWLVYIEFKDDADEAEFIMRECL